jgi:hypothetical protein
VATDPAASYTDPATLATANCYQYQYIVADLLGNTTTYYSNDIKIDVTASPPSAPTFTYSNLLNAYGTGGTVYYPANVAGGHFTVTAGAIDLQSGISGYTLPSLGSGWTTPSGITGVQTYTWSTTNPVTLGAQNATASNSALTAGSAATITLVSDITAPPTGSLSYSSAPTSPALTVTLAAGVDSQSGVGSTLLQRSYTTLSGSTCGSTYTSFATVATNPGATFQDSVSNGKCYKYQLLVTDHVGNSSITPSATIAKVNTAAVYYQTSGTDHRVVMEAENRTATNQQGADAWSAVTTPASFSGAGAMSTPDTVNQYDSPGFTTTASRLDYEVNFNTTGTQYVWLRGYNLNANADSGHVGLDYLTNSTADNANLLAGASWQWTNVDIDSVRLTINVPTAGNHTLNVYPREAGFIVDKIILITNVGYTPTGTGPAETLLELLGNNGFEDSPNTDWSDTNAAGVSGNAPIHTGSKKGLLGGEYSTNSLYQSVTIPTSCASPILSFWRYITSLESGSAGADDILYYEVVKSNGAVTALGHLSNQQEGTVWTQTSVGLGSSFQGLTVNIRFRATQDGATYLTTFNIDDVSLTC